MGSLVQVLGIKGSTEAEGDTRAEEDVVSQAGNTAVVDLGLYKRISISTFSQSTLLGQKKKKKNWSHLSERRGVEAVLAGNLKANRVAGLGVPRSLSTSLNLGVDTVVVASRENAQVVASGDGSSVLGNAVANGSGVLGDSGLLDVVATLSTDKEALMAEDSVKVGGRAVKEVKEGTSVHVGLLELEVEFGTLGLLSGEVLGEDLGLKALGDVVVELELGVEGVRGGPSLGEGKTWPGTKH